MGNLGSLFLRAVQLPHSKHTLHPLKIFFDMQKVYLEVSTSLQKVPFSSRNSSGLLFFFSFLFFSFPPFFSSFPEQWCWDKL